MIITPEQVIESENRAARYLDEFGCLEEAKEWIVGKLPPDGWPLGPLAYALLLRPYDS